MDSNDGSDSGVIDRMIDDHYLALRARFCDAHVRVFIEANMSFVDAHRHAARLEDAQRGFGWLAVERHDPHGKLHRYGVWTSKDTKNEYVKCIQLGIEQLRFAEPDSYRTSDAKGPDALKQELGKQLKFFHREIEEPKATSQALFYKSFWTGKSAGKKDDLVMVLGIALYNANRLRTSPEFRTWCAAKFGTACP